MVAPIVVVNDSIYVIIVKHWCAGMDKSMLLAPIATCLEQYMLLAQLI